jgi:glutaredoxin
LCSTFAGETSRQSNGTTTITPTWRLYLNAVWRGTRRLRVLAALTAAILALTLPLSTAGTAKAGCSKSVYVYSAPWCGTCRRLLSYLDLNRIHYTLLDADTPRVQAEMRARFGTTAVPQMLIGLNKVSGLDTPKIRQHCR